MLTILSDKLALGRFPIECRTTKTKVINLANQKGHIHHSEPIKTRSNYMQLTQSAGKRVLKPIVSRSHRKTNNLSTLK